MPNVQENQQTHRPTLERSFAPGKWLTPPEQLGAFRRGCDVQVGAVLQASDSSGERRAGGRQRVGGQGGGQLHVPTIFRARLESSRGPPPAAFAIIDGAGTDVGSHVRC